MKMKTEKLTVFAPATIANLSCGFDVLGLALDGIGDILHLELTPEPGVSITRVTGADIPLETDRNVAGIAGMAFLEAATGYSGGVRIEIEKRIAPGSGIGSSAASSAGTVWGLNQLLGEPFGLPDLVGFAMKGEALASGAAHADNVAPALYGGITLVRSSHPLDIARVHCPEALHACILHPQIELKTSDARKVLRTSIPLSKGIRQWGNVGGLVTGLFTEDFGLISRSLEDCIIEPVRSLLIPGFDTLREAALAAGALGFGISGSGPSVYALTHGADTAEAVSRALGKAYDAIDIPYTLHHGPVNRRGIYSINPNT
ncbi:homoserine kinase [Robiginitalea biformata]|uniref:Homoserine kinase n=1 Tax=Robiginitalea biformata (strain ATCC BAA-864 / DSM 15991 / KCTC 12146 / HTCC2501) TaxID=313596 RepID=A4CK36_ROBBH|nr:homoserine kinase [Robiginitalea biformata HTCC2501]